MRRDVLASSCARLRSRLALFAALALSSCGIAPETPGNAADLGGIVVESVLPGALQRAGIEPGDRILAWRRAADGEGAALSSPFELWAIEHEETPRGAIEVRIAARGEERWVEVPPERWRLASRPSLTARELELYRRGREAFDAGEAERGEDLFRRLAQAIPRDRAADRAWAFAELAKRLPDPRSEEAMAEAIAAIEETGNLDLTAFLHAERGALLDRAGRLPDALEAYRRSLELRREAKHEIGAALLLAELGRIEGRRGNPAEEERLHRLALEELDRTAPESLEVSRVLRGLARARATQDDVEDAFVHAARALEIAEKVAPRGFDHQAAIMIQGIFHWIQEDWERAESRLLEGLALIESLDPEHEDVSNTLHNLGLVASYRGDYARASDYFVRSLESYRSADPIQRTRILNSLGTLAIARYDLASAERWLRQVLEIRERLTPGSLNVATPLVNLGDVAQLRGAHDEAERLLSRALELQRTWIPESRDPAMTLLLLATVSRARGDLDRAEERAVEALAIVRERFPGVLLEAEIRHTLGAVRHEAGRSAEGLSELERAISLFERLAPDTTAHALAVYDLARIRRATGRREEALADLLRAVEILERQVPRVGGSDEVRSRFRGELLHLYRDGIELLLELSRPEEAFHLLERSQARLLLALLAERGIDLDRGLPARYTELSLDYDRLSEELEGLSSERDGPRIAELSRQLDRLRLAREEILRRTGDPRRAVLASSAREVLDVERALEALPDDAVALSFCVAAKESWAFVLGPGRAFRSVALGVDEADLEDRIGRLRLLIETPGPGGDGYLHLAASLFRDLVAPAAPEIERARRVILVPDGPLHLLPFAVLFQERPDSPKEGRHLVEWRPLQIAPSLTVLAALGRRPASPTRGRVVAFVDPPIPARESRLEPLPHARREAEALEDLYGERAVAHVGDEATEASAKDLRGDERILHFATHGILDRHSPLDSGLLLAASPGGSGVPDNGFLQAWEIFESVRTSADLVTLSACESASGRRVAGEGLQSLTRAFLFAGARSVLASLWRVSDRSTALLMERFYRRLAAGEPRYEALRGAQLDLLGEPDHRHPHYWAAFQLYGGDDPSSSAADPLAGVPRQEVAASKAPVEDENEMKPMFSPQAAPSNTPVAGSIRTW